MKIVTAPLQHKLRDLTDADAVRLAQQGDAVAFEGNYRLHSRKVHRVRLHIAGAPAAAEDLLQILQLSYEMLEVFPRRGLVEPCSNPPIL